MCALDVGAGTGILSFFAAQAAGGRRASLRRVEASGMAVHVKALASGNGLGDIVTVLNRTSGSNKTRGVWSVELDTSAWMYTHIGAPRYRVGQRAHARVVHLRAGQVAPA